MAPALAVNPDNNPGCGLGKLTWSRLQASEKYRATSVMMATTNGTFGVSFGTPGCTNDGQVMVARKPDMFVALTFETISEDMVPEVGQTSRVICDDNGRPC